MKLIVSSIDRSRINRNDRSRIPAIDPGFFPWNYFSLSQQKHHERLLSFTVNNYVSQNKQDSVPSVQQALLMLLKNNQCDSISLGRQNYLLGHHQSRLLSPLDINLSILTSRTHFLLRSGQNNLAVVPLDIIKVDLQRVFA